MPLLHEIKDPINGNILCFVPNGHLTENGFEDFPAPSIVRSWHIWHYANRRLASLKHTQNPFSEQEYGQAEMYFSQLADNIYALKYIIKLCMDTLYDIGLEEIMNVNQEYLINYLNTKQDQLHDHLKAHCAERKFSIVNVKTNNELFMEIFLKVGEIIATNKTAVNFNNPTTFNETMQMLVDFFLRTY